ncbi:cell division protein FtsQ [Gordonibacter sp. An230]|uniref:cell division protein FtsQ/DivIB n=1 Tax=Gordonibacter sp. An230 TaxID=1965592 RepID=UPI000B3AF97B|nr:FtsQ-type POTRA domain-containing protein [Gordonibacter sp. An230]OUO90074.1 cell division protein FtsQ [Gordonibacter sp. An230]
MASNYNRKSASSGSRKASSRTRGASRPSSARSSSLGGYRAIPGGQLPKRRGAGSGRTQPQTQTRQPLSSVRVGDLDRVERNARAQRVYRRHLVRLSIVGALLLALVAGGAALYVSDAFAIESVQVSGVEHLTATEMTELAAVPADTTLLRVDTGAIRDRLLKDAWVESVEVRRVFPHTLELVVVERTIAAVVEVPTEDAESTQDWAVASDGMWLMPIPPRDSEAGKSVSPKVYEDAESVLRIVDVPYGTSPATGAYCTDANVNNALSIVAGMTTDLAGQVRAVAATETESTTLTLESGVEIVFGSAENIRDKERVCLKIMEEHPDVVYINVRVVDRPTWRSPS